MKTQIDLDKKIIDECQVLISKIKPIGPITVQLIREKSTHDDYFIEINPRFGGGVPLTIKAGADSPQFIISMLCHLEESIQINTVSNGKIYTRYDQSIECTAHASSNGVKYKAIVFDLDDTLYSECDYVRSGFNAIGTYLANLGYGNQSSLLFDAFKRGISSPIDYVLKKNFLADDSLIATCVEVYRSHFPTINLYPRMKEILLMAKKAGIKLGIITDGRIEGQKNKIKSLFLEELIDEIVISDSLGGVHCRKPSDVSFRYIQSKLQIPFEQMLFIGDNPKKDLHAPNVLGMGTWWFKNIDGLYFNKESIDIPIRTKIIMDLESLMIELNSLLKNESTL